MPIQAKYVHTNIVAEDWRALVQFYQDVFGCTPLPPERNYQGSWITDVTAIADVSVQGMHVRLPGYGDDGPTLEIFHYSRHSFIRRHDALFGQIKANLQQSLQVRILKIRDFYFLPNHTHPVCCGENDLQ